MWKFRMVGEEEREVVRGWRGKGGLGEKGGKKGKKGRKRRSKNVCICTSHRSQIRYKGMGNDGIDEKQERCS